MLVILLQGIGGDRHHQALRAQEAAVSQDQPHPGEGIANLLSQQLLTGRLEQQQRLLVQSELKLVQAQINPPFLFSTSTPSAPSPGASPSSAPAAAAPLPVLSQEPQAPERPGHPAGGAGALPVPSGDRACPLWRQADGAKRIPPALAGLKLPSFTLQPLIENAIKHGISTLLEQGRIRLYAEETAGQVTLHVEDNAGTWQEKPAGDGLGMTLVDRRLKRLRQPPGLSVSCVLTAGPGSPSPLPREAP